MGGVIRRVVSLVGLAVLVALAAGYRSLPRWSPPESRPVTTSFSTPEFHRFDRAEVPGLDDAHSPCSTCHPASAHVRDADRRAFLNLHRRTMDCGVCHLKGKGVAVRHFRGEQAVTKETLGEAPYGRVYAAIRKGSEWQPVLGPGDGVTLRAAGPKCQTCHRRGSPMLATGGLVDGYRRGVLESLSVLRFLRRGR